MVKAIAEGYPQREIADAAYRFQRELDAGERTIVGVNSQVDPGERLSIPLLEVSEASKRRHLDRLERTRRDRDAAAVACGARPACAMPRAVRARPRPT